jgi:hypothetical protein
MDSLGRGTFRASLGERAKVDTPSTNWVCF